MEKSMTMSKLRKRVINETLDMLLENEIIQSVPSFNLD